MVKWPLQRFSDLQIKEKKVTDWIPWSADFGLKAPTLAASMLPLSMETKRGEMDWEPTWAASVRFFSTQLKPVVGVKMEILPKEGWT